MNPFLIFLISSFFCISGNELKAQTSLRVLFLGNSYTGVNNLPQLVRDVALSNGDTLDFDSYTPGGYQLIDHSQDTISQSKIMAGGWDYVVIQGQSQEPIMDAGQFTSGAEALYNRIKLYNSCAVTMLYMTWGRKYGDAANCPLFPLMCTYEGMDTTIRDNYLSVTESINGEVSPVSVVWRHLRQNFPAIELYQPDESHPSTEGSYAAACCFYAAIFKKDPTLITYNFGINANDASVIRDAVKTVVFDNLQVWDYKKMPVSGINYQTGPGTNFVFFNPGNYGVRQSYLWDFGDGDTSSIFNSTHSYLTDGSYLVSLTATTCDLQGLHSDYSDTIIQFCSHTPTVYTLLPWVCNFDTLWTEPADSYQWIAYGLPIPVYSQYLPNYAIYGSGLSVLATSNGCTELSEPFVGMPQWPGYYFDIMGNPCAGDTVAFAVLHINGFLSGLENILWLKNDTILPLMTNEDTLLITVSGKYECKVINPTSKCPLDTTAYSIEYNCSISGIEKNDLEAEWTMFPNPASETLIIQFKNHPGEESIQVYSVTGGLMRSIPVSATSITINITDLAQGLYYLRLKNGNKSASKFIKL